MTKKEQDKAVEKGEAIFSTLREKQTVYSTDADLYHVTGEAFHVHPTVAASLIEKGLATSDAPEKKSRAKKGE